MNQVITVEGYPINIDPAGFICLTDMAKAYKNLRAADVIKHWLSNQSTIDFLGLWESIYNATFFKVAEFHTIKEKYKTKGFQLSAAAWIKKTGAIGIISHLGKHGGTYAHIDIATEFGSSISVSFKLYLIKEYHRLTQQEREMEREEPVVYLPELAAEWDTRRFITKNTYAILRNAIGKYKLPHVSRSLYHAAYAEEGDILNMALFKMTANEWRKTHPELRAKGKNIRDDASITELAILSSLETMNAEMLKNGRTYEYRLNKLREVAAEQRIILMKNGMDDKFKRLK